MEELFSSRDIYYFLKRETPKASYTTKMSLFFNATRRDLPLDKYTLRIWLLYIQTLYTYENDDEEIRNIFLMLKTKFYKHPRYWQALLLFEKKSEIFFNKTIKNAEALMQTKSFPEKYKIQNIIEKFKIMREEEIHLTEDSDEKPIEDNTPHSLRFNNKNKEENNEIVPNSQVHIFHKPNTINKDDENRLDNVPIANTDEQLSTTSINYKNNINYQKDNNIDGIDIFKMNGTSINPIEKNNNFYENTSMYEYNHTKEPLKEYTNGTLEIKDSHISIDKTLEDISIDKTLEDISIDKTLEDISIDKTLEDNFNYNDKENFSNYNDDETFDTKRVKQDEVTQILYNVNVPLFSNTNKSNMYSEEVSGSIYSKSTLERTNSNEKDIDYNSVVQDKIIEPRDLDINSLDKNIRKDIFQEDKGLVENKKESSFKSQKYIETEKASSFKFLVVNGKEYLKIKEIGSGGSGRVYMGCREGTVYAIKKIFRCIDESMEEVRILEKLRGCEGVVELFEWEKTEENLFLVFEYGEYDLKYLMQKNLSSSRITDLFVSMLQVMENIYEKRIVHCDIKPANFIFVKGEIKLIDFGISKNIKNDTTNIYTESNVGTIDYMAPERILENETKIGRSADVWSLGIILYEMIYKKTPLYQKRGLLQKIDTLKNKEFTIEYNKVSEDFLPLIKIIKECLKRSPKFRPTVKELTLQIKQNKINNQQREIEHLIHMARANPKKTAEELAKNFIEKKHNQSG